MTLRALLAPALAMPALLVPAPRAMALPAQPAPKEPFTSTTPSPNETPKTTPAAVPVVPDYAAATWAPALRFTEANRPEDLAIDTVVIHDIEGSADACVSWFQNPQVQASSHYVTNAKGQVWQMVREKDIAWHAGNWKVNQHSIGIENEGYAYRPGFFDATEYEGLAKLVRDITTRYQIPRDRTHIIGHFEIPNPNKPGQFGGGGGHTDPGPYWDWGSFMTLVRNDARFVKRDVPAVIRPGELLPATVSCVNGGDDLWTANSSGAQDDNVAAKGGVYLGVWPLGTTSPFFNYKYWTSPRMASSLTNGDTEPGREGTFAFQLLGPRRYGPYTQQFRVTYWPVAPSTPTAFGEILNVNTNVVPWDIVLDLKAAKKPEAPWQPKGDLFWRKAGEGSGFEWTTKLPIRGKWDVYARWAPAANRTRSAAYSVSGEPMQNPYRVVVDQRKGGGWVKLGRFEYSKTDQATVSLLPGGAAAKGIVVAQSVRFVGPF